MEEFIGLEWIGKKRQKDTECLSEAARYRVKKIE